MISQSIGFGHGNDAQPQKKIKEMSTHTVMSGHIVRYLVYVRVCYLLLGWWYLTLTARNQMVMGKPRRKKNTMAKNMTRKGLAFGAGVALVASGFAGVPANAVGIDNSFVSLAPTTGTEYDQLQSLTLDLTGSFTNSAASGATLKYLVTDPDSAFRADVDVNASSAADTVSGITNLTAGSSTFSAMAFAADLKTITFTGTHDFNVGDKVTFAAFVATDSSAGDVTADSAKINATHFITEIGTTATFKIVLPVALTAATATIADASGTATFAKTSETGNATRAEIAAAPLGSRSVLGVTATVSARAADGSFVVNTADTAASGVDNVLRLVSTAAADTSATATVTAWIDNNDNDLIESTEYVSPTRTVRFLKTADVAFTTTWDTLVLGGGQFQNRHFSKKDATR